MHGSASSGAQQAVLLPHATEHAHPQQRLGFVHHVSVLSFFLFVVSQFILVDSHSHSVTYEAWASTTTSRTWGCLWSSAMLLVSVPLPSLNLHEHLTRTTGKLRQAPSAGFGYQSSEARDGIPILSKIPTAGLDYIRECLDVMFTAYQSYLKGHELQEDAQKMLQLKRTTEGGLQVFCATVMHNTLAWNFDTKTKCRLDLSRSSTTRSPSCQRMTLPPTASWQRARRSFLFVTFSYCSSVLFSDKWRASFVLEIL